MLTEEEISKFDCGIRGVTHTKLLEEYPQLTECMMQFPDLLDNFFFDLKVHMLMPGQFPCIPNWHRDFVPRDLNNKLQLELIDTTKPLYLIVSGGPITEFKDGRAILPWNWVRFTQDDLHRGTVSKEHCWRLFIRASHKDITPQSNLKLGKIRHSQVYLDAKSFVW